MKTGLKIMIAFMWGCGIGIWAMNYIQTKPPTKFYPIEIQIPWNNIKYYTTIECDSVIGNTIHKDGNKIVTKKILNITLK